MNGRNLITLGVTALVFVGGCRERERASVEADRSPQAEAPSPTSETRVTSATKDRGGAEGAGAAANANAPTPEKLLQPGPEAARLQKMVGTWDVTMSVWPTRGAQPTIARGMVADRTMTGLYLNETLHPAAPSPGAPDFRRIDHLTFDPVQARWEYASIDTRAPIGIMFAKSYASGAGDGDITVFFDNFTNPGIGPVGAGIRARHVDSAEGDDRTFKRQYWTRAGEPEWLAIEYAYTRRK